MPAHYTAAEIAQAIGQTERAIQKRATKDGWPAERIPGRKGKHYYYPLSSLPPAVRGALEAWEIKLAAERGELPAPPPVPCIYNDGLPPAGEEADRPVLRWVEQRLSRAARMDQRRRDVAQSRLAAVVQARQLDGDYAAKAALAAELKTSYDTLQRWTRLANQALEAATAQGADPLAAQIEALAPVDRSRGQVSYDEEAVAWALRRYLNQSRLTLNDVHRDVLVEARVQGWRVGSHDTLRRVVAARVPSGALVLARQGKRAYEAQCVAKLKRRYDDVPPGFMLVGDHHILDAFVLAPDGVPRRPWLTAWLDVRTRAFVGWAWSFRPNSRTIALALRHAILPKDHPDLPFYGLPISVYVDNGKDYKALDLKGREVSLGSVDYPEPERMDKFAALGIEPYYLDLRYDPQEQAWKLQRGEREHQVKGVRVGGVFNRLAVRARYATAYHPWAKVIERAFGEVVRTFSRRLPGWCGSNPQERPERLAFELKNPARNLLTMEALEAAWVGWLTGDYHARPHSGEGLHGLSPRQCWDSLARPEAVDPAYLDFALSVDRQVKVQSHGFRLPGLGGEYQLWLEDQRELAAVIAELVGQRVDVLYDPSRPEILRVIHQGKFVCWARTLQRGSYVTDAGLAEHARLQALQRRRQAEMLDSLGASPTAPVSLPALETFRLAQEAEAPALAEPETPALPPEFSAERPELFDGGLDRYRWAYAQKLMGRDLSERDAAFLADYEERQELAAAGIREQLDFYHQNNQQLLTMGVPR